MFLLKANCDLESHYKSQLCSGAWTAWRIMLCYVLRGVLLCLRRLYSTETTDANSQWRKKNGQWYIPPYSGFVCNPNARDRKSFWIKCKYFRMLDWPRSNSNVHDSLFSYEAVSVNLLQVWCQSISMISSRDAYLEIPRGKDNSD